MSSFADLLGKHLQHTHTSVNRLAKLSGVPQRTISNWLNGYIHKPHQWQALVKVALALHLPEAETNTLLQSAGHPLLAELGAKATSSDLTLLSNYPNPQLQITNFPSPFQAIADLPTFVGRENELETVKRAVLDGGRAAICGVRGMGGVGKTALAAHLAYQVREQFPDGILWARLDTSDPLSILGTFAEAYGKDVSQYRDVESRAAVVRNLLAGKRALVILDNAENSAQVRPMLPPSTGTCAVLITTRQDLSVLDGWTRLTLGPFDPASEESLQLLQEYLGEAFVERHQATLREIATLLGHLPLALAIAAGRLAYARPTLTEEVATLSALCSALHESRTRLDTLTRDDLGVRASFDVSYAALTAEHQKFFAALGVFGGEDFSTEAVAYVTETPSAGEILKHLLSLSLVQESRDGRWRLHPLLKDYAREKITDLEGYGRALMFFVETVEAINATDFHTLDQDVDNILHALEAAYQYKMPQILVRGVLAHHLLLRARGLYAFSENQLIRAEQVARESGDPAQLLEVLVSKAKLKSAQGYDQEMKAVYQEVLSLARTTQNRFFEAQALGGLGELDQALQIAREINAVTLLPAMIGNLGVRFAWQGDYARADVYFEESVRLGKQVGKYEVVIPMTHNRAWLAFQQGDFDRADVFSMEAISLARTTSNREVLVGALRNHGESLLARGEMEEGNRYMQEALSMSREIGEIQSICEILAELGRYAFRERQWETAGNYWQEALQRAQEIQSSVILCQMQIYWAEYCLQQQQLKNAETILHEGRELAHQLNLPWLSGQSKFVQAKLLLAHGQLLEAVQLGQEGLAILESSKHPRTQEVQAWLKALNSYEFDGAGATQGITQKVT
ncbi:MAG: hypothetical protein HUU38_25425 [Anaerolineales bacterium]|nr:hypothetical protein [Anaerolineales bacterium]